MGKNDLLMDFYSKRGTTKVGVEGIVTQYQPDFKNIWGSRLEIITKPNHSGYVIKTSFPFPQSNKIELIRKYTESEVIDTNKNTRAVSALRGLDLILDGSNCWMGITLKPTSPDARSYENYVRDSIGHLRRGRKEIFDYEAPHRRG